MKKWLIGGIAVVLVLAAGGYVFRHQLMPLLFQPTESSIPVGSRESWSDVETVASDLYVPWSMAFLPAGDMLVTERSGTIKRIGEDGKTYSVDGVRETSEGGLLGIALHPEFARTKYVYVYLTTEEGGTLTNKVERYAYADDTLSDPQTILADIPAASNHNGGSIAFGPDDKLYITTGDAAQRDLAQDTSSLAGKILRLNDDGSVPEDNPLDNLTWSYGHRNPQGMAWDSEGRMWSVEHGPSGEWKGSGKDELNMIEKGANYGWPVIAGSETAAGMQSPVAQSGEDETWAPSGMAYLDGSLYFAGLRGETLYEAEIHGSSDVTLRSHFAETYGRLRGVAAASGSLYFTTSNTDGRGTPQSGDDKVLRVKAAEPND